MLGIDIIDLTDPDFRARDARALRLITSEKDTLIDHPKLYWLLWSAKEAIFKCRREPVNFTPAKIPVEITKQGNQMGFQCEEIEGRFEMGADYLLAYCAKQIEKIEYRMVRSQQIMDGDSLRAAIVDFFSEEGYTCQIGGDDLNLPVVLPDHAHISLSHHRHCGAFAYPKSLVS